MLHMVLSESEMNDNLEENGGFYGALAHPDLRSVLLSGRSRSVWLGREEERGGLSESSAASSENKEKDFITHDALKL